jgi:hypothetical protein
MFSNTDTLAAVTYEHGASNIIGLIDLLNDVGAELLNRERADVANELTDDGITEPVIVEVEDILHDLTN